MRFALAIFILLLLGCGTFRTGVGKYKTGTGEFKGVGDFKTSGDYANDENPEAYDYTRNNLKYEPHGQFAVFWPVVNVKINRGFHPKSDVRHAGIDLGGAMGEPIRAAHEGIVIYAGKDFRGYGNMVILEYNEEWATLYAHLKDFAVREGMILSAGDPIGSMGKSGNASGIHLHFELLHKRQPVDPMPYLGKNQRFAVAR